MIKAKIQQLGFTLIELIVVMVLIGALAAVAIPRFINQTTNARVAALNGLQGAILSAAALAQAQLKQAGTAGTTGTTTITMDQTTVSVGLGTGAPVATLAGIGAALSSYAGFTPTASVAGPPGTITFSFSPAIASCTLTYTDGLATGPAANTTPTVSLTTTSC